MTLYTWISSWTESQMRFRERRPRTINSQVTQSRENGTMDQTKQHPDLTSFSFLGDSMCSRLPLQGREFTVHNTLDLVSIYTDTILLTCIYVHMEKSETLFLNQQKMDEKQEKEKLKQKHKQE